MLERSLNIRQQLFIEGNWVAFCPPPGHPDDVSEFRSLKKILEIVI